MSYDIGDADVPLFLIRVCPSKVNTFMVVA